MLALLLGVAYTFQIFSGAAQNDHTFCWGDAHTSFCFLRAAAQLLTLCSQLLTMLTLWSELLTTVWDLLTLLTLGWELLALLTLL